MCECVYVCVNMSVYKCVYMFVYVCVRVYDVVKAAI